MSDFLGATRIYEVDIGRAGSYIVTMISGIAGPLAAYSVEVHTGLKGPTFSINDLEAMAEALADGDLVALHNLSTGAQVKVTLSTLAAYVAAGAGAVSSVFGLTGAVTIPALDDFADTLADADSVPMYDASAGVHREVTLSQLATYFGSGGGAVSSVFGDTGEVTIPSLADKASPAGADTIAIYDQAGADHKEATLSSLPVSSATQAALDLKADSSHTHAHNDTTSKQGGTTAEYYHLTSTQHSNLTASSPTLDGTNFSNIPWSGVLKTGSNLTDLATANHNDLDNKQGGQAGEYYHLTSAQVSGLHAESHTVDSHSDTTATGANLNTLVGGGNTTLHYHNADRVVAVEDDDAQIVAAASVLNFAGAGVVVSDAGSGQATITIAGGGGGTIITQDEGVQVDASATTLNFVGAGVVAADAGGGVTTVTIAGGAAQDAFKTIQSESGSAVADTSDDTLSVVGGAGIATSAATKTLTISTVDSEIDHDSLSNTHNLTTDIDHDQLTNYSADEHRMINDLATGTTDLWSASKINTELGGKSDTSHTHALSDLSSYDHKDLQNLQGGTTDQYYHLTSTQHSNLTASSPTLDGTNFSNIPWSGVLKTGSNLTDIATRSHTALSDIGSTSHADLDTHVGGSSGVHGVTGSVVGTSDTQTLSAKTLTQPTIADFTNATHNHQANAGGGQLDHTSALTNVGSNTHAQIDTHLGSTSNPHSVTAAQASALALTGGTLSGDLTISGYQVVGLEDAIEVLLENGGDVLAAGIYGVVEIKTDLTLQVGRLMADAAGTVQIDLNRYTSLANYIAGTKASITSSTPLDLSSEKASEDSSLTSWTVDLNKGDFLEFEVDASPTPATVTWVVVSLKYVRR